MMQTNPTQKNETARIQFVSQNPFSLKEALFSKVNILAMNKYALT